MWLVGIHNSRTDCVKELHHEDEEGGDTMVVDDEEEGGVRATADESVCESSCDGDADSDDEEEGEGEEGNDVEDMKGSRDDEE